MVQILKSGVDFTGCVLSFALVGISLTCAHCRQSGAPRKPALSQVVEIDWEVVLERGVRESLSRHIVAVEMSANLEGFLKVTFQNCP